ncbi:Tn3 transposase DDE domain-containing protein [Kribbella orskensis]|uniref:Tn3 transposase DDE domain-containing protein n=1 Tax=Kribbella orskensis TaxID=2512216 RepID=A0ABY2B810_9ACTN|nr:MULTISPECIES: Tn3 family transposase [Kribbella]TCN30651.1 Tn3 transposase DDE domain-containing protein [Kribbella sp. VKM Ac-2500]TCO11370.1 Tn3 transposase DDE domain-containing protein [Kribbella orskensis]
MVRCTARPPAIRTRTRGRAQKTLCVARGNGGNSVIFFGRGGDIASSRRDEQDLSVLCLRVLQSVLVYVNTLMVQDVLADDDWADRIPTSTTAASPR